METNREVLKSSARNKRKKTVRIYFYGAIAAVLLFLIATNYIFHLDRLYIRKVYISGNKKVESGQIFSEAKDLLIGTYYWMYPRSNFLIYPKAEISKILLNNIPWLASVKVSASSHSLNIAVTEREPKYLWCDSADKSILDRLCYYLDKDGLAFDVAPSFSGHIYLEFYGGNKNGGYVRRTVLPPQTLRAVLRVADEAGQILISKDSSLGKVYGVYINSNGDYDLLISDGKRDWKVNFDLNVDPVNKLKIVLDNHYFEQELSKPGNSLEYIDLRFGKKVFYKFDHI